MWSSKISIYLVLLIILLCDYFANVGSIFWVMMNIRDTIVLAGQKRQLESLLAELQARSPKLTLNLKDGVIYAIFEKVRQSFPVTQGTCVNDGAFRSCQRIAKFYELEQRMINDGYDGRYAIVTADFTVNIVSTEDEAIRFTEKTSIRFTTELEFPMLYFSTSLILISVRCISKIRVSMSKHP